MQPQSVSRRTTKHIGTGRDRCRRQQPWRRTIRRLALVMMLILACTLLGWNDSDANVGATTVITFVGALNTEAAAGLPFLFMNGGVFHSGLTDRAISLLLNTVTPTAITVTLATTEHWAQGVLVLDACDFSNPFVFFRQPSCLYDMMITFSNFPLGTGPQIGEVLMLQDWLLIARVERPANRVTVILVVEEPTGVLVPSELLEVDGSRLCPWVCAGP